MIYTYHMYFLFYVKDSLIFGYFLNILEFFKHLNDKTPTFGQYFVNNHNKVANQWLSCYSIKLPHFSIKFKRKNSCLRLQVLN